MRMPSCAANVISAMLQAPYNEITMCAQNRQRAWHRVGQAILLTGDRLEAGFHGCASAYAHLVSAKPQRSTVRRGVTGLRQGVVRLVKLGNWANGPSFSKFCEAVEQNLPHFVNNMPGVQVRPQGGCQ